MTKLKDQQYPDSMSEGLWEQEDHADDFDAFLEDIGYRRTDDLETYLKALTAAFKEIPAPTVRTGEYKYDIFLSYKSEDKEIALKIHNILTKNFGLVVWMDKDKHTGDLHQGGEYWERIRHGIENSRYFMPVVSKAYLSSFTEAFLDGNLGEASSVGPVKEIYMALNYLDANEEKFKSLDSKGVLVYSLPIVDIDAVDVNNFNKRIEQGILTERFFKGVESYFYSENSEEADTFRNHNWDRYTQE